MRHEVRFRPLPWLKTRDLIDCGLTRTQIERGRESGALKYTKLLNGCRYKREDVEAWLGIPLVPIPPRPGSPRVAKLINDFMGGKSAACGPDA